jgi:hypothetical protein
MLPMRSRIAMALLSMPLALAGWLTAHSLAYTLAAPHDVEREELLADTGHGYLEFEPELLAGALVLVVVGLLASVAEGVSERPQSRPAARILTLMPVLGFVVIEPLERLLHDGAVPYGFVFESTFLVGLALQLPFAVAALGFTRALHGLGRSLGHLLWCLARPARLLAAPAEPPAAVRFVTERARALPSELLPGHGPRAPPVSVPA